MHSWKIVPLHDISLKITKGTTPTTIGRPFRTSGISFIKAEALNGDSELDENGFSYIDEDTNQLLRRSVLQENDVLITIAGAKIGKCGYVKSKHLPANTNQAVGIVRLDIKKAVPRFVYYFFKNAKTYAHIQSLNAQAAQPNINLETLGNLKLCLPSYQAQDRIADILSAYDDLIENNRRRIQLLEQSARLLYKEWFVRLRFPGHERVKIKNGVPEGWRLGTIEDLGNIVTGKTPIKKNESFYGKDIPFIKTPDMHGNTIVVHTEENLSEKGANSQPGKTLPSRSILVSCIGTVGIVSLNGAPAQTNQQINAIVPKEESLRYWTYFMAKELKALLEGMGGGATMPNVNKSKFSGIKTTIPSKIVLDQFNQYISDQIDQIERLSLINLKLAKARDLLLPRLMNGEIIKV